ncbi:early protein 2 [Callithrix penicillata papillomavirus type 1]|uniref:Regulatory protein E2 n=1 Tax=Callithrix penicillata papillomavirus type 1 TaxID=2704503 RepID=A0A6C0T8C2_9PAPI|nr:early protein 2 [Callithrix penicillata papillomavirus type 1]
MEKLTERFDSIQEELLAIYERGETDLSDLIKYWDLIRQENLIMYYARQRGLSRIGMQHLPALRVSEVKAKQAIHMKLVLTSLQQSQFGDEPWTLPEVSQELYDTNPPQTLKKSGRTITVTYDNDPEKEFPYTLWKYIYYQDEGGEWHKTTGHSSHLGLYYVDNEGFENYYENFQEDANRYSTTGHWEVHDKTRAVSTSVSRPNSPSSSDNTRPAKKDTRPRTNEEESPPAKRPRLGRGQGESRSRTGTRAEADSSTTEGPGFPSPGEVGSRTTTVGGRYRSRLARLQAEARDPPLIILKGGANTMKCWRNRAKHKYRHLYTYMTSVFQWLAEGQHPGLLGGRMLISFDSEQQQHSFLKTVQLPKGVTYALGSLESL